MSKDKQWTKKELQLRPGIEYLVAAVIEQWRKDGEPKDKGIEPWLAIAKELDVIKGGKNDSNITR